MNRSLNYARIEGLNKTVATCASNIQFIRVSEILLSVLKKEAELLGEKDHLVIRTVFRANELVHYYGFLNVAISDLSVIIKNMYVANEEWETNLYGRQSVLLIVESIKAYNDYNKLVKKIVDADFPQLKLRHKRITDRLRLFKKKYNFDSKLIGVRNNAIGHINRDFRIYCGNISGISARKMLSCSLSFLNLLKDMEALYKRIAEISTDRLLKNSGKPLEYYLTATRKPFNNLLRKMPKLLK